MKKYISALLISTIPILGTTLGVVALSIKPAVPPIVETELNLSTKQGNENLIEIFADGFDYDLQIENLKSSNAFDDFFDFSSFYNSGNITYLSTPSLFGGFEEFNNFAIRSRNNTIPAGDAVFENDELIKAFGRHFTIQDDKFSNPNVLGMYDFSKNMYEEGKSEYEHAKEMLPNVNFATWTGMRDNNAGSWGITNNAPDTNAFDYLDNNIKIDNSSLGGRVFINDSSTHPVRMTGEDGNLDMNANTTQSMDGLINSLEGTINSLKSKSDEFGSVYDNSMIVIYGDHGDHGMPLDTPQHQVDKAHSNLLVKFPHQHKSDLTIVDDKLVYGPQLNYIINQYFETKPTDPYTTIFENNPLFDIDRPMYIATHSFDWTPTINNNGRQVIDSSRDLITLDWDNIDSQSDFLFNNNMGGVNE